MSTILVVDDTDTNIEILSELLGDDYDIMAALDGEFALEIVNEDMPDLVLLDIMMPDMDGYEVCQKLKLNPKTKDIPVIFITAKDDEESIEKAYDVGGIDYVTKPFKPKELMARVKTQLKMRELIQDLEKTQEELKLLASTDPMTKLYNRRYFSKISEHIIYLAKRDKKLASVIMLDIDKFKHVNDTYGHNIGDEVIINLSVQLQELTRNSDIICRYGGEEFVILLPDTCVKGAVVISEKIRETVEQLTLTFDENKNINYTVSIGVSEVNVADDLNIEASLIRADEALYEAKESGRNRVVHK
ncbi:MAG: diguanylate cyclase response regulator [Epsilonproteobacteria bacterium]|nr:MAG: diguanylate cyclase response regulator [Campylobacterota bacterium]